MRKKMIETLVVSKTEREREREREIKEDKRQY